VFHLLVTIALYDHWSAKRTTPRVKLLRPLAAIAHTKWQSIFVYFIIFKRRKVRFPSILALVHYNNKNKTVFGRAASTHIPAELKKRALTRYQNKQTNKNT